MTASQHYDVLVIGSGAAGLTLALRLPCHLRIALVAKGPLAEGASLYAQGGVSAVLEATDSVEAHVADTVAAGAGLVDAGIARRVARRARSAIQWLLDEEVPFSRHAGEGAALHLHREGGHSHRRIVHAADTTGRAISGTLEERVRARPNVAIFEHHVAVDLTALPGGGPGPSACIGARILGSDGEVRTFGARCTVLATGGASKVYLYSSNPDGATGDGIAMAWRFGCRVANMEFNQFHPTCLYHPAARSFLLSEALRGEGARLLLPAGEPFMHRFDERAELAPRDIVARAIDHEMKRLGLDCVYLDISHRDGSFIESHFPGIHERCLALGYDLAREPVPVVPAAHYTCGGVLVDRRARTDAPGLYAIGETACSGLHGANRLASNSLLECLVFATIAADDIALSLAAASNREATIPDWDASRASDPDEKVVVSHNWDELRRFMWDYVGIVRTDKGLARALARVQLLRREIREYYGRLRVTADLVELRNLALVAELVIRSARSRRESRGLHYTLDYPHADPSQKPRATVLHPAARGSD